MRDKDLNTRSSPRICGSGLLATVRLGVAALTEEACTEVATFCKKELDASGGFKNRAGQPELYYTYFGVTCLTGLQRTDLLEATENRQFLMDHYAQYRQLGFVDLCCLIRSLALIRGSGVSNMAGGTGSVDFAPLLAAVERYRSEDGGYNQHHRGGQQGTAYAAYLAALAYQDCRAALPNIRDCLKSLDNLRADDGGFANYPGCANGTATATASVVVLKQEFAGTVNPGETDWLLKQHVSSGGFTAGSVSAYPDLLSTSTALYALYAARVELPDDIAESCVDFVDSLWRADGGFAGHPADAEADIEYTFYALLALGSIYRKSQGKR